MGIGIPGLKRKAAKVLSFASAMLLMVATMPSYAADADEPGTWEMAADATIARPIGAAITVVGAAAFVVSLPFSALGGNVTKSAEKLVLDPARAAFVRCLGCRTSGRLKRPKDED